MKPWFEICNGCDNIEVCTNNLERCDKLIEFQRKFAEEKNLPDFETLYNQRCHKKEDRGWLCPVTGKVTTQLYTDSQFLGVMSDGSIRVIPENSCKFCGDANFTVGGRLRELNEKRKKEMKNK